MDEEPTYDSRGSGLPAADDVQRVDAEPMGNEAHYRYGRKAPHFQTNRDNPFAPTDGGAMPFLRPPVLSTWICLLLAWFFLGSKVPFTVFIGVPFALVALLLATVCLSRGGVVTGVLVMLLGTAGSLVVYIVGLFRFLARM